MISKIFQDEEYTIRKYSLKINISNLIDAINKSEIKYELEELKIEELPLVIISEGIDEKYMKNINDKRRDEPIIITIINEELFLIDGNHRLNKRIQDGFKIFKILFILPNELERFIEIN